MARMTQGEVERWVARQLERAAEYRRALVKVGWPYGPYAADVAAERRAERERRLADRAAWEVKRADARRMFAREPDAFENWRCRNPAPPRE